MSFKGPVKPIVDVEKPARNHKKEAQATVPASEISHVTLKSYESDICRSGHDFFHAESFLLVCYTPLRFSPNFGYDIYSCRNCRKEEYRILSKEGFENVSTDLAEMGYFTLH